MLKRFIKAVSGLTQNSSLPSSTSSHSSDSIRFSELGLGELLLKAVTEEGYQSPTPIQAAAIPEVLKGRDLLGCAQTGTGKTAAFALPILARLMNLPQAQKPCSMRVLVLTPTRELALQVGESFKTYGRYSGLKTAVIFGGVGLEPQRAVLKQGVDILVATPGRYLDLHSQGAIRDQGVKILVLDEADRMLDMGFIHDVKRIIKSLPKERQNLLFSATMPKDIKELSDSLLKDPAYVEVTPVSSTSELVSQWVYHVSKGHKKDLLLHVLRVTEAKRTLVFARTKHHANRVAAFLCAEGIRAEAIHGNKSQSARQRALENFRSGATPVLVASDLAARGLDIDEISHVINFELPNVPETYVHRIGRTGRAMAVGQAHSFCDPEELSYLRSIERLIGQSIEVNSDHPFHQEAPKTAAKAPQRPGPGKGSSSGGQHASQRTQANGPRQRRYSRSRRAPGGARPQQS